MKEYSAGGLSKHKTPKGLVWRGFAIWREGEGDPWHKVSRVLTDEKGERIPARPGKDDNRGRATAEKALERWIRQLEQADAEAEHLEAERAERERLEALKVNVASYVDSFIDTRELLGSIERSTVKDYKTSAKLISAEFAKMAVQDLTRAEIESFEIKLLKGERLICDPDGKVRRKLSKASVRKCHKLLKMALKRAVIDGLIPSNPVEGVEPPGLDSAEKNCLRVGDCVRFLEYATTHEATPVVCGAALALFAGLGPAESCALRWSDVDLENKRIHIGQAIGHAEGGTYVKKPKTGTRRRDVYIPSMLADILRRRREVCTEECKELKMPLSESMYVLGYPDGRYYAPVMLSRGWTVLAESEGYSGTKTRRVEFYALRHSYATISIAAGVDVASLSASMGHSSTKMTVDTYADATKEGKVSLAEKLEDIYAELSSKVIRFEPKTGTDDK